ncbi:phosphatase PAP2 family protein [Dehalogenimonas alkenigignens]|uniref:PAP2 superfamily n=1 Tax=Dehalogenimonas alkenigignens TaxID=1217799 RepID=A0A0W0GIZ5_9CHLR|nr:phosphatase PAP2 family protein [Dehalogenimonas alkenigignens]KTB48532.1 PAP2 superfamily [Dehalogenimonas alkenigignens]PVV85022.1 phosphatase PAP2 family protein [Dehalogenimonas alkenigignens]
METLIRIDQSLALFLNFVAGRLGFIDEVIKGLANDYFTIVGGALGLFFLWFGSEQKEDRRTGQEIVLQGAASIGLTTLAVYLVNIFFYRTRPFDEIAVNALLYQPTDSSFPANSASILFGLAFTIWLGNRKYGRIFLTGAVVHSVARVIAGMHYPGDIAGGLMVGLAIAFFTRLIFKLLKPFIRYVLSLGKIIYLAD